jgi:hypothetical protein
MLPIRLAGCADFIAKFANGFANYLLSSIWLVANRGIKTTDDP